MLPPRKLSKRMHQELQHWKWGSTTNLLLASLCPKGQYRNLRVVNTTRRRIHGVMVRGKIGVRS